MAKAPRLANPTATLTPLANRGRAATGNQVRRKTLEPAGGEGEYTTETRKGGKKQAKKYSNNLAAALARLLADGLGDDVIACRLILARERCEEGMREKPTGGVRGDHRLAANSSRNSPIPPFMRSKKPVGLPLCWKAIAACPGPPKTL